ncbi:aminopeptidase-like domain-containing protein [Selenomonas sp. GACV-9]|uniref:DUF4910 domain-containing protein n=1 Tax=Selenomonas sp. GACV-9 TaxID=3158782 RepID=UPI0008E33D88|nr:aminopeptidase-like domain-containing protein [Selenomonas ruminantium]
MSVGDEIYAFMEKVFPYCRSITGDGVRQTLRDMKRICPLMTIHEVPSGTQVFDWKVPNEWNCHQAYIENSKGERIIDFKQNNLHVVSYSQSVDKFVNLEELKAIVHTYPKLPEAIPYVTSYYKEMYGFCMSQKQWDSLPEDTYHIVIDSSLTQGALTYGEVILPGDSEEEILFSTYVCHPSMANNELSGPGVAIHLAKYLSGLPRHKYTYRFVFVPETIGSITYLSRNYKELKDTVVAGFNLSCLGDDLAYTYVASKYGDTLADKVAKSVMGAYDEKYHRYSFLKRGSDERQYNMPGIDLPVVGLYRSKSNEYDFYHTSLDNMDFVSAKALEESYEMMKSIVQVLEKNHYYQATCLCEPQLGRRGLYPTTSVRGGSRASGAWHYIDFLAYADGKNDLMDISCRIEVPIKEGIAIAERLLEAGLVRKVERSNGL